MTNGESPRGRKKGLCFLLAGVEARFFRMDDYDRDRFFFFLFWLNNVREERSRDK